jgi:hypothetical protein
MDRVVLTMPKINPTCVCITILTEPAGWDVLPKARAFWCVCVCVLRCMHGGAWRVRDEKCCGR